MYLHIGHNVVVSLKNVIAILDLDNTTISKITKEFLTMAEEEGFIKKISDDLPKAFIICEINKKSVIYISPISTTTLFKRINYIDNVSNVLV